MPSKRITCFCRWCGTSFLEYPKRIAIGYGKYCSRNCYALARRGDGSPRWKGGRYIDRLGYVQLSYHGERIYEHRLVMQQHLGRKLRRDEHIHHINGNRQDNRIENLRIVSREEHMRIHYPPDRPKPWSMKHDACIECGRSDRRHAGHGLCNTCESRHRNKKRQAQSL